MFTHVNSHVDTFQHSCVRRHYCLCYLTTPQSQHCLCYSANELSVLHISKELSVLHVLQLSRLHLLGSTCVEGESMNICHV